MITRPWCLLLEWKNDEIIEAARNGDIDTLVSLSCGGIDIFSARSRDLVSVCYHVTQVISFMVTILVTDMLSVST